VDVAAWVSDLSDEQAERLIQAFPNTQRQRNELSYSSLLFVNCLSITNKKVFLELFPRSSLVLSASFVDFIGIYN